MTITYSAHQIHVITRSGFGITLDPFADPRLSRVSGRTLVCRSIDDASAVASELRSWGIPTRTVAWVLRLAQFMPRARPARLARLLLSCK